MAPTCPEHQQCSPSLFLLTFFLPWVFEPAGRSGRGLREENFQLGFAATRFLPHTFPAWQRAGRGRGCNTSFQVSVVGGKRASTVPPRRHPRHGSLAAAGSSCRCMQGRMAPHLPPKFHFLLALPMIRLEAQKCSVRNVFRDEDEYLGARQHKH